MKPIKIAIIVGTRPELIKMAPVYLEMKKQKRFNPLLLVTAQHRQMLDSALATFQITPDVDLNLMTPNQTLAELSGKIVIHIQKTLEKLSPQLVLVQGDTTTCFFSALAAFYQKIPIGHIEAGLRTYDMQAPWPEEMHRRLTDPICDWCFAPTVKAAANLRQENVPADKIVITGNTIVDALLLACEKIPAGNLLIDGLQNKIADKKIILVTGHRRENFGNPFENFCSALKIIAQKYPDIAIVYPVHLNPNVQKQVKASLAREERIILLEPLEYLPFVSLLKNCKLIITDSGGIQEEAPTLQKPVIVTRNTTERPEAIEAGYAKLVGTSKDSIVDIVSKLLDDSTYYQSMIGKKNPYGDGRAAERIINSIAKNFC